MPTVNAKSTFGNYQWKAHAEVSQEQFSILADLGFLWVMQRSPSSRAEKAMAGYEKRPEGFKRNSIGFDETGREALGNELAKAVEIAEKNSITPVVDEVEFYEIGAGAKPVYAEEKTIVARHVKDGDFAQWMSDEVGFAATAADADSTAVLAAVKAYKQRRLKEL